MVDASELFEPDEIDRLRALRRAAAQINESSVMRGDRQFNVTLSLREEGGSSVSQTGPEEEPFRSFVIPLRRTYLNNDQANFQAAANVLARRVPELRQQVADLKAGYETTLKSKEVNLYQLSHGEIFEAWLHGHVFHDDNPDLRERWQALTEGPLLSHVADFLVQSVAVALAEHVLRLDGMIAEVLGEERLPSLPPSQPVPTQPETRADVRVQVRQHGQRGSRRIDFVNVGDVEARNVTMDSFRPLNSGHEDVLLEGEAERKFPVPRLRDGERVSLLAAPTMGSPTEFEVVVSWDDPSGDRRTEAYRIDLIAV